MIALPRSTEYELGTAKDPPASSTRRSTYAWLSGFNAFTAIAGGVALSTGMLTPPHAMLNHSMFTSYTIPGALLTVVVGGSALMATLAMQRNWQQKEILTLLAGLIMLGWIGGELVITQTASWLQVIYLATGSVQIAISYRHVLWHFYKPHAPRRHI